MARMLPGIETLDQHQKRLREDPEVYRPERCCHCGKEGMHQHGHYERNVRPPDLACPYYAHPIAVKPA